MPETKRPSSGSATPALEGDLFEFAAGVVEQKVVERVVGDEDIGPAVEVVIRHADAHAFSDL